MKKVSISATVTFRIHQFVDVEDDFDFINNDVLQCEDIVNAVQWALDDGDYVYEEYATEIKE